jgi:hypothetical protein
VNWRNVTVGSLIQSALLGSQRQMLSGYLMRKTKCYVAEIPLILKCILYSSTIIGIVVVCSAYSNTVAKLLKKEFCKFFLNGCFERGML